MAETVLSVTIVAADGTIARTAHGLHPDLDGHDLRRLVTGSWGTRAIIAEAEISLTQRPETQRFVWIPGTEAAADLLVARRVPDAVNIERPPGSPAATVVLIEGETDEVEAEVGHLVDTGATPCGGTGMVGEQSATGRDHRSVRGTEFHSDPHRCRRPTGDDDRLSAAAARQRDRVVCAGRRRSGIRTGVATRVVLEHLRSFGMHFIAARLIHAPAPVWDEVDAWGPAAPGRQGLYELKALVDPRGILAPGRGIAGV